MGDFMGILILLVCTGTPVLFAFGPFVLWIFVAVGAMVPMYAAFGIGFLVRAIYRALTYIPPRRAVVD